MILFTESPYEKKMIQKPKDGKWDKSSSVFPALSAGYPYKRQFHCIGKLISQEKSPDNTVYDILSNYKGA